MNFTLAEVQPIDDDVEVINHLPLDMIHPDPDQPRKTFDPGALADLAADIKARGVKQPITVRVNDDNQVIIVMGERRWRASKLAGLDTIPTITSRSDDDDLERLLDQVSENMSRDDLKPLEIANFINQLYTTHNIKLKDIPDLIKQRGLKPMEGSYVRNMRRLLELPDWARDWIDDGTITPSHGKYILQAKGHDQVMDEIKKSFECSLKDTWNPAPPKISELPQLISEAFEEHYPDISVLRRSGQIKFDIETCKGCQKSKLIKDGPYTALYCFDETCRNDKHQVALEEIRKQHEAEEKKQARKTEMKKPSVTGMDDEPAKGPEEQLSPQQEALKAGRIERTEQYLDSYLIKLLQNELIAKRDTKYDILLWCAAGAPGNANGYYTGGGLRTPEIDHELHDIGINITLKGKLNKDNLLTDIVNNAVESMTRVNLRRLAHHLELILEDDILTEEYLSIKSKQELIDSTPIEVRECFGNWGKQSRESKTHELIEWILEWRQQYDVPQDLQEMYNAYAQDVSGETEE
jgi:ParB/RepB/Spo0J family partition protein